MKLPVCVNSLIRKRQPKRQAIAKAMPTTSKIRIILLKNGDESSGRRNVKRRKIDTRLKTSRSTKRSSVPWILRTLPPDSVRLDDKIVIVQDLEIKPKNTKFQQQVFYSSAEQKHYRRPLSAGCDRGNFSCKG